MLDRVRGLLEEYRYYESASSLFNWDQWLGMPPNGAPYRQKLSGFLSAKAAEVLTGKEALRCAGYCSGLDPASLESDAERGMVRTFLYLYGNLAKIPPEKLAGVTELASKAQLVWQQAHSTADYALFKPYLVEMFALKREIASLVDRDRHPMDVLAGMCDEGIDTAAVSVLLGELREGVSALLRQVLESGVAVDDSCIRQPFDKGEMSDAVRFLAEKTGYDSASGGYGEVIHPFTVMMGPRDARITTNYDSFSFGIFAAIHEAGHAMYAQRSDDDAIACHLWGGNLGAFHESQSRFYENIIGKSKEYWTFFYPEIQRRFPQLETTDLDVFFRAVNKVQPSFKRVLADELTYSLHPIIRFEIERDLFDGRIDFDSLPEIWNDRYEQYLGIRPQNDREGVLQDVHWAMGLIGYFQSYALGNLYGGQFRHRLLMDVPDVYGEIAKGNFEPINGWLTEKIHRHGRIYAPAEIVRRVTGEPLSSRYFLEYLREKYGAIYKLPC